MIQVLFRNAAAIAAVGCLALIGTGCTTTGAVSSCDAPGCGDSACVGESCTAGCSADNACGADGCPNCGCEKVKRWSDEWYAERASDPIGARQRCYKGKLWPPTPRHTGRDAQLSHRYHAAHYWPYPYYCQDRAYVNSTMDLQAQNGWVEEATLYDYHFEDDTGELNHPGRLHVRWILENAPEHSRMVWVQTAMDSDTSQTRLSAVREAVAEMVGEENIPPVVQRVGSPRGRPALEVETIQRAIRTSAPEPRIQYTPLPSGVSGS